MRRAMLIFVASLAMLVGFPPAAASVYSSALVLLPNGQVVHTSPLQEAVMALATNPTVWDGTPSSSNWQISEAVREWNKRSAFEATMSTSETADVRVTEVYDPCGVTFGTVLGCAYSDGTIHLNPKYANEPLAEHVGGHELGHTFGHPHSPDTVRSWMKATVSTSTWLRAPQQYDYAKQQELYGR